MSSLLSTYFSGIGAKRLSDVEIAPAISNQHEFNGIGEFKSIFGTEKITFHGRFLFLADNDDQVIEDAGILTWYDAREKHETRTEYRLYYSNNSVIGAASPGDLLVIGRTNKNELAVIIAPAGSTSERQVLWLFGIEELEKNFIIRDYTSNDQNLDYAKKHIVTSLGIELIDVATDHLDEMLKKYNNRFPSTAEFSDYARSTFTEISPVEHPDETLISWLEREESLFKTLEKHFVEQKLKDGFGPNGNDVDEFISFSLSIQNRRKSRAGFAFENHLTYLFDQQNVKFSRGKKTERNNKPDFLFPGIDYYNKPDFNIELLTMLGVKTTAKDRWRQVLSEADRINRKHLMTLEPAISKNQTDEMKAQNLQLVIPKGLMETFSSDQQNELINLSEFITMVKEKQTKI